MGLYSEQAQQIENGQLKQIRYQIIDCSQAVAEQLYTIPCTSLAVVNKMLTNDGNTEIDTDPTCIVWIRLNHQDNLWFPLSLDGTSKNLSAFTGTINKFWVKVRSTETQAGKKLVLVALYSLDLWSANTGAQVAGGYETTSTPGSSGGGGGAGGSGGTGGGGEGGGSGGGGGGGGGGHPLIQT